MRATIARALRSFLREPGSAAGIWDGYTRDALALAQAMDCDNESLRQRQQNPERVHADPSSRSCNWYMPVFDSAFYGGVMTILRLADHLKASDGIKQRILICGTCDTGVIARKVAEAFPGLAGIDVIALDSVEALATIPPSDYSVATLWVTAYVLLKVQNTGYKFYMIQDYEPLFYPAGATYAQAELTYRFGFYGIANTESLRDMYVGDYGGRAVGLTPNVDTRVFHPGRGLSSGGVKRLFYYARPGTPRNGFELAVAAFKLLKHGMGDEVEIVCAGANWNPADYGLQGIVSSVGMLPYEKTGELYRSCHVGLVMMMTKHPSYLPFELMACGTLVVSNTNPANTWFLRDGENCLLSAPTASCLAEKLTEALRRYEEFGEIRANATKQIHSEYGDWSRAMTHVAKFMHSPQ